jgi:hypothetical protein
MKKSTLYENITARERVEMASDWLWEAWESEVTENPFEVQKAILGSLSNSNIRRVADKALQRQFKVGILKEEGGFIFRRWR